MKFVVVLAFVCLTACYGAAVTEKVWGTETQYVLGNKKVEVKSGWMDKEVHTYTFTYPEVRLILSNRRKKIVREIVLVFKAEKSKTTFWKKSILIDFRKFFFNIFSFFHLNYFAESK